MSFKPTVVKSVTLQLTLTNHAGGFKSDESMMKWIEGCLNCNTNHVKAKIQTMVATEVQPEKEEEKNKPGPYGLTSPRGNPICEECDTEMNPFAGRNGQNEMLEGWGCDTCGWSIDKV